MPKGVSLRAFATLVASIFFAPVGFDLTGRVAAQDTALPPSDPVPPSEIGTASEAETTSSIPEDAGSGDTGEGTSAPRRPGTPDTLQHALEGARDLFMQAEFRNAERGFEEVLDRRDLDATAAALAHGYLAALRMAIGGASEARPHVEAALALDANAMPPEGSPSTLAALWIDVRRRLDRAMSLEMTLERTGEAARVSARLDPPVQGVIHRVVVECDTEAGHVSRRGSAAEVELSFAASGEVECWARAESTGRAVLLATSARWHAPESSDSGPGVGVWLGIGAAALVVVGVVMAVVIGASQQSGSPVLGDTIVEW